MGPTKKVMIFVLTVGLPGAAIHYTLDGSAPTTTHGTLINQNVGRVDLSRAAGATKSFTLQAIGSFSGMTPSNVTSFSITLTD
jgi:hypothetical protein